MVRAGIGALDWLITGHFLQWRTAPNIPTNSTKRHVSIQVYVR